jgi:alcohol dehydrogenase class IV
MRFNAPACLEPLAGIARLLGADLGGLSAAEAADQAALQVQRLCRAVGIPQRLRDLGARSEQLPEWAEKSFALKRLLRVNPRPASEQDLLGIFQAAF